MRKELGKIKSAEIGFGGYQDAMFGVTFNLGGESWGVFDFWGTWSADPTEGAHWTKSEQLANRAEVMEKLRILLIKAKKINLSDLKGIPIECFFEGNAISNWRILTEVL